MSKIFLLIIIAHSRWMQVEAGNAASKQNTFEHLRSIFSRFGLPQVMVIDNGTCFTSYEFKEFARLNHICHLTTILYQPLSNGLAERAVQTSKFGMKKNKQLVQSEPHWLPGVFKELRGTNTRFSQQYCLTTCRPYLGQTS